MLTSSQKGNGPRGRRGGARRNDYPRDGVRKVLVQILYTCVHVTNLPLSRFIHLLLNPHIRTFRNRGLRCGPKLVLDASWRSREVHFEHIANTGLIRFKQSYREDNTNIDSYVHNRPCGC